MSKSHDIRSVDDMPIIDVWQEKEPNCGEPYKYFVVTTNFGACHVRLGKAFLRLPSVSSQISHKLSLQTYKFHCYSFGGSLSS
jgi:hypothetical protein